MPHSVNVKIKDVQIFLEKKLANQQPFWILDIFLVQYCIIYAQFKRVLPIPESYMYVRSIICVLEQKRPFIKLYLFFVTVILNFSLFPALIFQNKHHNLFIGLKLVNIEVLHKFLRMLWVSQNFSINKVAIMNLFGVIHTNNH